MSRTYNSFQYDITEVQRLTATGASAQAIADILGAHIKTVYRIQHRCAMGRTAAMNRKRLDVLRLYNDTFGACPHAIAEMINVSYDTVRRWLKEANMLRPHHLRPHFASKSSPEYQRYLAKRQLVLSEVAAGVPIKSIAKVYRLSETTIRNWIKASKTQTPASVEVQGKWDTSDS